MNKKILCSMLMAVMIVCIVLIIVFALLGIFLILGAAVPGTVCGATTKFEKVVGTRSDANGGGSQSSDGSESSGGSGSSDGSGSSGSGVDVVLTSSNPEYCIVALILAVCAIGAWLIAILLVLLLWYLLDKYNTLCPPLLPAFAIPNIQFPVFPVFRP